MFQMTTTYTITVQCPASDSGDRQLRALLKRLLRGYGLWACGLKRGT
jgi:hypothetical protein